MNPSRSARLSLANRLRVQSIDEANDIDVIEISQGSKVSLPKLSDLSDDPFESNSELKIISKEREIFLKAALQLLDKEEKALRTGTPISSAVTSKPKAKNIRNSDIDHDIIRYGILKKASHTGPFSALTPQWRKKYVELRHGQFGYEEGPSGWKGDTSGKNKKIIPLSVGGCQCRPFKIRSPKGDCVFELTLYGGSRRLWMARSEKERNAWVEAIHAAMIGSGGNVLGLSPTSVVPFSRYAFGVSYDVDSSTHSLDSRASLSNDQKLSRFESWEGPAAIFALDISKYYTVQSAVRDVSDRWDYKIILERLYQNNVEITVPVFYVRSFALGSKFVFSSHDALNQHVECSQVWKDLQRDSIMVNGEKIMGENGAEAMVGALMRHILDHVNVIQQGSLQGSRDVTNSPNNNSSRKMKCKERFEISESETLSCARDLLVLCNRTQSGGDTYFCVDALLCNKGKDLCIVTPLARDSDPMVINIDIVEEVFSGSQVAINAVIDSRFRNESMSESHSRHSASNSYNNSEEELGMPSLHSCPSMMDDLGNTDDMAVDCDDDNVSECSNMDAPVASTSVLLDHVFSGSKSNPSTPYNLDDGRATNTNFNSVDSVSGNTTTAYDDYSVISDITTDTWQPTTVGGYRVPRDSDVSTPKGRHDQFRKSSSAILSVENSRSSSTPFSPRDDVLQHSATKSSSLLKKVFSPRKSKTIIQNQPSIPFPANETGSNATSKNGKINKERPSLAKFLGLTSTSNDSLTNDQLGSPVAPLSSPSSENHSFQRQSSHFIRVEVSMLSRYRICDSDPQDDATSTWAEISGVFQQVFFIKSGCQGKPLMTDRTVTITVDECFL